MQFNEANFCFIAHYFSSHCLYSLYQTTLHLIIFILFSLQIGYTFLFMFLQLNSKLTGGNIYIFYLHSAHACLLSCSVQFSRSVMSDSLWPHGPQHARPSCPSLTTRDYSNSCPLSQWSHPIISSSVMPFSSCLQSFPAPGSFQMSQFFASGGQSIGVSASASVLQMNIEDWFPLRWTGWISLQSKELSRVFSNTTVQKHQFFGSQLSSQSNSHAYMTTGKTIALTRQTFVGKLKSLLFNMLSRLVITPKE